MDPMDCPWITAVAVVAVAAFSAAHLSHLTRPADLRPALEALGVTRHDETRVDKSQRYERELNRTRAQMLNKVKKFHIHVSFCMTLVMGWSLMRNPSLVALTQFLASAISYVLFALPERITGEDAVPSYVEAIYVFTHGLWALGIAHETDLVTFCVLEKVCGVGLIFMSVIFIDLKAMLCLYAGEATLLLWNQWHLVGVDRVSMMISYSFIVSHVFVLAVIVVVDHTMRSIIFAKVDASDASSLMLGFRQVLRGVCDGDLLLDKSSCSIVDDASCLERLLKSSKKLSKTNFLDLFLDSESRQRFLHFLSSQDDGTSAGSMPRGLRISLQGADGAVSIDVFQTKVPNQGATGTDYCLLALKEDPESAEEPPEASSQAAPPISSVVSAQSVESQGHAGSTASEVVESYNELVEFALLVSNETAVFDVKEAHLAFRRQSSEPAILSGMPTLRRFIRPSDWDRMEKMFDIVTNLPPSDVQQRCTFRHPMLFRLPGESRSYLCSRQTSVYLAGEVVPDEPVHFWMNFSSFDTSQIRRPREPELQGIREE
ncbi:unnamed protein product [Cladocopium goreaui]|uniref:Uncharacterized protein n=1 Tax=Cladocopium goreaui TaxID=2562237 RepID=A0A9P1BTE9_9DINO|nr:unnamed protein product [Cladocopium goreaui]